MMIGFGNPLLVAVKNRSSLTIKPSAAE